MFRFWAKHWILIIFAHVFILQFIGDLISDDPRVKMGFLFGAGVASCALTVAIHQWYYLAIKKEAKRIMAGECSACGYDLRATTDRCPECGRVIMETRAPR